MKYIKGGYVRLLSNCENLKKGWVPKVDDWIIPVTPERTSGCNLIPGKAYKVLMVDTKHSYCRVEAISGCEIYFKDIRKARSEEIPSETAEVSQGWIPKVGEYAVMEAAGGWSYDPRNNGCVGLIDKVSKREIDGEIVISIFGTLVNPRVDCYSGVFNSIPIFAHGKVVCRKAEQHEIPDIMEEKPQKKDMLVEAKERYPVGTTYKCACHGTTHTVTVQYFIVPKDGIVWGETGKGCLMYNGRWAEIIVSEKAPVSDIIELLPGEIIVKRKKKVGNRLIIS